MRHFRERPWHFMGVDAPSGRFGPEEFRKRRFLFRRFARFFGLAVLVFMLGMAGLAYLFTRLFGGGEQVTFLVYLGGCGLAAMIPILTIFLVVRSFAHVANPLAQVMAAADAVAEGDFSVRLPEGGQGEFGRLSNSFNRMVSELERTDLQRRNLTADVAHELRTPLTIIQGNLEGILDGVYEPNPDQLNLLLDETRQLTRLVEDLRTLSLAETGQLSLEKERLDLNEILQDVVTSFSGPAEEAGVRLALAVDSSGGPLTVLGDAGRLDQVLSNLVANALRFTPSGGQISLSARAEGGRIIVQVSDTGKGISPEDLPFVFDRFWKGDPSRQKAPGSGSGLGLAIARQLVQAHGGKILAESVPGQGATFTIDLPQNG